jgi:hypothetical protein
MIDATEVSEVLVLLATAGLAA